MIFYNVMPTFLAELLELDRLSFVKLTPVESNDVVCEDGRYYLRSREVPSAEAVSE